MGLSTISTTTVENELKVFIKREISYNNMVKIFNEIVESDSKGGEKNKIEIFQKLITRYEIGKKRDKVKFRICKYLNNEYPDEITRKIDIDGSSKREHTILTENSDVLSLFLSDLLGKKPVYEAVKFTRYVKLNHKNLILTLDIWLNGPNENVMYFELESDDISVDILKEVYRLFYDYDFIHSSFGTMKLADLNFKNRYEDDDEDDDGAPIKLVLNKTPKTEIVSL